MSLSAEQIKKLKTDFAIAKKKPLSFGLCLGKKPDATVLMCHKTKPAEVLGRMAKKEGETTKIAFGTLQCEGKILLLSCVGDPPPGLAKRMKLFMKSIPMPYKVKVLDMSGNTLEDDGDEDIADGTPGTPAPQQQSAAPSTDTKPEPPTIDPLAKKWDVVQAKIDPAVKGLAPPSPGVSETWTKVQALATSGDYAGALKGAAKVVALVQEARSKPKADQADPLRPKWVQAEAKLRPLVDDAVADSAVDSRKISALWSVALAKAGATPPDFRTAIKAAGAVAKQLGELATAKAPEPALAQAPGGDSGTKAPPKKAVGGTGDKGDAGKKPGPKPPADAKPKPKAAPDALPQDKSPDAGQHADLSGTVAQKITRAEAGFKTLADLIAAYGKVIPGSADPVPPAWTAEIKRLQGVLAAMKADPAKADEKKLDLALTDISNQMVETRTLTTEKQQWKKAHDLFVLSMAPLEHHAQAAATPQIKPKIDAIKAGLAAAVVKANGHDFKGATAALPALGKRCGEVEILADGYAHYASILPQRQSLVAPGVATPPTDADALKIQKKMELLLAGAQTDAGADKFTDAVKKLDQIPTLGDKLALVANRITEYTTLIAALTPAIAALKAYPAKVKTAVQAELNAIDKTFTDFVYAKTKDYVVSCEKLGALDRFWASPVSVLKKLMPAISAYETALTAFNTQYTLFKDHKGRPGIEDFFIAMTSDFEKAKVEAADNKHATGTALLNRTSGQWPAQKTAADQHLAYTLKRKTVAATLDELRKRPAALLALQQADALMTTATSQALSKDCAGALTSVVEAEARAADAKAAADAQDELGKLKDTGALDKIATDFDAAYKVFTDMRAKVVGMDSGAKLAALIAKADAPAKLAQDEKAKPKPDFAAVRKHLDGAIALLENASIKAQARVPYETHLAAVKAYVTGTLTPLSLDDCIKVQITAINALIVEAENLVKPEAYDFAGAEAKLSEANKAALEAKADGALWPSIKTGRTTTQSAINAIAAVAAVVPLMTKRTTRLNKIVADIATLTTAKNFKSAQDKAREGAGLLPPTQKDITTCRTVLRLKGNWVDHASRLPSIQGAGKEAAAKALADTNTKLANFQIMMTAGNFDGAANLLNEIYWSIQAGINAIAEKATYEPARVIAAAKIKAVADIRNSGVEAELALIEAKYAAAVADAAKFNFRQPEAVMKAIPAEVDPLLPKAQAYKLYLDANAAAGAKITEAKGHDQVETIVTVLARLSGKFGNAVKLAEGGDLATATKMMTEIVPACNDAIEIADDAWKFEKINDAIADSSTPWGPTALHIAAARKVYDIQMAKPTASVVAIELTLADSELKVAAASGTDAKVANAALTHAMDLLTMASQNITAYGLFLEEAAAALVKIAELNAHTQVAYIAPDVQDLKAGVAAAKKLAGGSATQSGASVALETTMAGFHKIKALANAQQAYLDERAKPEIEPRLDVLERHKHRYAIKANIDTIRAKLATAATRAVERKHDEAMKLLSEIRALGTSSLVLADMRENKPPSVKDVKAILNGPGGTAELDAMVAQLEPDAKRKVLKVAFEARFGCKLQNFSDAAQTSVILDAALAGPNIQRFYEEMAKLPPAQIVDNDSMRTFSVIEDGKQGSLYSGAAKDVVMREGSATTSTLIPVGAKHAVGTVDPGCEPADTDPVTMFSWNTLHEAAHAIDDKQGFMNKNGSAEDYGGWTMYERNVQPIAKIFATKFKYDETYISQYMEYNNNPAIPALPTSGANACTPEEWESKRIAVCGHIDCCKVGFEAWDSASLSARITLDGMIYQESYQRRWSSYKAGARSKGISGYQFRAPAEWFAELYAAYHSNKLKPAHPAVDWLSKL